MKRYQLFFFGGGGSFKKTNKLVIQRGNKCEKCFRSEKMFSLARPLFHHAHSDSLITDLCEALSQPVHCGGDSGGRGRDVTKHAAGGFGSCQASLPFSTVTEETHFTFYCFSTM